MRDIEVFLLTYGTLVFSTVAALSLLSVEAIEVYATLFAIEFFVASEVTSPFSPVESKKKTIMGIALLTVFTIIIAQRVLQILR